MAWRRAPVQLHSFAVWSVFRALLVEMPASDWPAAVRDFELP